MPLDCPTPRSPWPTDTTLIHQALPYNNADQFLAAAVPFLSNGVEAGDLVMCASGAANLALLCDTLPADTAAEVDFVGSQHWYRSPAQALSQAYRLIDHHAAPGRRVRFLGEPLAHRSGPDGLTEAATAAWMRYEARVNVMLAGQPAWLICPYDITRLGPQILHGITHAHPMVATPNRVWPGAYDEHDWFHSTPRDDFDEPPDVLYTQAVTVRTLGPTRNIIRAHARNSGLDQQAADLFVVAASEAMTNAIQHAGGMGVVRLWQEYDHMVCEVADYGSEHGLSLTDFGARPDQHRLGLRFITELCHRIQVSAGADGTVVRLHSYPAAAAS